MKQHQKVAGVLLSDAMRLLKQSEKQIQELEDQNYHFSIQMVKLTEFLMTQEIDISNWGKYSSEIAIDEIKRLKVENERLKKELIKVQSRGM